jgi:hypothetical protein
LIESKRRFRHFRQMDVSEMDGIEGAPEQGDSAGLRHVAMLCCVTKKPQVPIRRHRECEISSEMCVIAVLDGI